MTRTTGKRQPSDVTVRIATMCPLPAVLRELGYDPAEVLDELGLELSLFDNPENTISYTRRSQLVQHCVRKTQCPHLGHLVGRHIDSSSLGLLGLLMHQSPDVETALNSLVRYAHLHVRGAVSYLEKLDEIAFLGYSIIQPGVVARDQIVDGAVTILFNTLKAYCGPQWHALSVYFAHSKPADTRPFREYFNVPLIFDAERNGIFFSADWLQEPVVNIDPELRKKTQQQIDHLEIIYRDNFAEQVRRVLNPALLTHQASADQVAALFSIHQRTMNRRLNTCGTSFQKLTDQSRFEIARQLLENTSMQLSQIAETLGYAEATPFSRAFRRWSGTTPSLWREKYDLANA